MRSGSGKSARLVERLGGNFGWRRAPQLVSLVAADADNSAFGVSEGDTLTISFDLPTDTGVDPPQPWGSGVGVGVTAGDKDYVDSLFRFCPRSGCGDELRPPGDFAIVVGADYEGAWTDESTFVVTILDAGGSEVALGETVVMARHAPTTAASAHRPIRFKGGVSAQANST